MQEEKIQAVRGFGMEAKYFSPPKLRGVDPEPRRAGEQGEQPQTPQLSQPLPSLLLLLETSAEF